MSTEIVNQPSDVIINSELISYFLDRETVFEIENDDRFPFNTRIITFLNRKYEVNAQRSSEFNSKTQFRFSISINNSQTLCPTPPPPTSGC